MGGSKPHTHRLVMRRPGVFQCVYCGHQFDAGSPPEDLAPPPAAAPAASLHRTPRR